MKFLFIINRNYLLTTGILLVLIIVSTFFILKKSLIENTKEYLLETEQAIIKEIKDGNNLPNLYPTIETVVAADDDSIEQSFKTVILRDHLDDNEEEEFMEYKNIVTINKGRYRITLRKSLVENDELLVAIAVPLLSLLALSFLISFFITRNLNKKVWENFEYNLGILRKFSFKNPEEIKLRQSGIQEFNELNSSLKELTNKLLTDYQALKAFTEHASHEIQTPISIISINLEEALQHDMPQQTFQLISNTQKSLNRLSRLNKDLLLITKIENRQFAAQQDFNVNKHLTNKLEELSSLLKSKNLEVNVKIQQDFKVNMNPVLADILLNNLLTNAVKHNTDHGTINIEIKKSELKICNTGNPHKLTNETIFHRFTKENSQSYGLGLAIVKHICDTHNITIEYRKNEFHCFVLTKNNEL